MNFCIEYLKSFHRLLGITDLKLKKERENFFYQHKNYDWKNIPIFIVSYNRLSYLKKLVQQLENRGYVNIKIIDNASTYKPLLDYYDTVSYDIFRLKKNDGHMAFWKNDVFDYYRRDLYVVTDPDVSIIDECPNDFIQVFYRYLENYPRLRKVGFSLRIDDIPKEATLYDKVTKWEKAYTRFKIPFNNAYTADIDTTFALYLPDHLDCSRRFLTAIRTGYPYQLRHLPWYKIKDAITEEDRYYSKVKTNGFWNEIKGELTEEGKIGENTGWISK